MTITQKTKPRHPRPKLSLLDFQEEPSLLLTEALLNFYKSEAPNTGRLVVMPTRCGKTYVIASALRNLQDTHPTRRFNPELPSERFLILTPASVKMQFQRVLIKAGVKNFNITSPTSMSAGFGDTNLSWISVIKNGVMHLEPIWDDLMKPDVIILDECQWVKNKESNIAKVIISAVKQGILVIFSSATPFTTLAESFVVSLGLRLTRDSEHHKQLCEQFILNNQDYSEPNHAAMERFNEYLISKQRKIEAHNIKFKHRVFNKCILIDFQTRQQAEIYKRAYEDYVEECAKHNKNTPDGWAAIMVAMMKFQQCAEALKSGSIILRGIQKVREENKQVIMASNFRLSLDIMMTMLVEKHNIPRHKIGIVIGGQNAQERQGYIDKFQRGEIDYFFLTLKSGGAGLSLHHELPQARPRHIILPPTYSAIDLIQALGRAHGPTSLSTTYQEVVWFTGKKWGINCIEEHVAFKVAPKMRAIKEMASKRETWTDLLLPDGSLNKEEKDQLHDFVKKEFEEVDEETGASLVDGLALEAFDNAEAEGENNLIIEV